VQFTPRLWFAGFLAGLFFAWPILLYERPIYAADSISYYKGGDVAIGFALGGISRFADRMSAETRETAGQGQNSAATNESRLAAAERAASQAQGLRSITYSVMTYLLSWPGGSLVALALGQAFLAGLVSVASIEAFTRGSLRIREIAAFSFILAFTTPVAFVSIFAMPDIFTGLLILAVLLPTVAGDRLSFGVKLAVIAIGAFAVSAHSSHPPLAAGLTILCLVWMIWRGRGERRSRKSWVWVIAPLLLGVGVTMIVNRVGVGSTSIVAKHYPLTLARSVSDGPARWYLEENCPELKYMVCKFFPGKIPSNIDEFLWGETGLKTRATMQEMDRIREEEPAIVFAAARRYPFAEASGIGRNIARQMITFLPIINFDRETKSDSSGNLSLESVSNQHVSGLKWLYLSMLAGAFLAVLALCLQFRRLLPSERAALMLVVLALLGNAAICVIFSGIAPRYQARVIWVLPLLALAFFYRMRLSDREELARSTAPSHLSIDQAL
jgi:hypothetical protein